jgi:hypothetical protein
MRRGAPLALCCGLLDGAASPLYARTRHAITLRFAAAREVADALGAAAVPVPAAEDASALLPHLQCALAAPHAAHLDLHLCLLDAPTTAAWTVALRWVLWRQAGARRRRRQAREAEAEAAAGVGALSRGPVVRVQSASAPGEALGVLLLEGGGEGENSDGSSSDRI